MAPPQSKRKSQGRKKIEMKLITDENARTVTFSKRRAGIFKKATELSILCGAHIAIIIFSLSGRAYSFGHPNVESVAGRFFNRNPMPNMQDPAHGLGARTALLAELKEVCERKSKELEKKKRRGKELDAALESSVLSDEKLSQLNMNELVGLKEKLERLRDDMLRMAAAKQSDGAGPSRTRDVDVVPEPLIPDQINPANVVVAAEPSSPEEINLANAWREVSPIPADWLKL
ncbi:agamous-like mads-box protein agl62 [Phtheirospermum japonicum]|uniref:Agamous-like mads-box protein agl62 n=1 Tax=Phtheirospermum japonicum TaxID=374723 RepID=A0A830B792_9LAMI|nr:agamous-like mads-box protein agl62 [Phtheirospermum japonicum]